MSQMQGNEKIKQNIPNNESDAKHLTLNADVYYL